MENSVAKPSSKAIEEAKSTVRVKRVANIYDDFKPVLWTVGEVHQLKNDNGDLLGFYTGRSGRYRDDLPAEIFNHQMKDLDASNEESLVRFMSEYGLFFNSWPGAIDEMARHNKFVDIACHGAPDEDDIDTRIIALCDKATMGPHISEGRIITHELWVDEYERMRQFAESGWETFEPKLFLVSYEEVLENIDLIARFVKLAKAAAQSETEEEIARLAGIEQGYFFDESLYLDQILNALLHVYQPKVGFQYIVDGTIGEPTYTCDLWDIHNSSGPMSASLMNAIALQIRDFNIRLSDARQCNECGQTFIVKQTARATSRAHSDSMFCCDRCKNKNAQRKYRESPGYKQKQAKSSRPQTNHP